MADTEHDIAVLVAEQQREREGCDACDGTGIVYGEPGVPESVMRCPACCEEGDDIIFDGIEIVPDAAPAPLRTEADWQHIERVIALLADELAEATECDRIGGEPTIIRPCPATDYCIDHRPDSLPCEDATCPAVIAAWAREKEDV